MQEVEREEKFEFGAEVPKLMTTIVENLYTSKDVFMRELLSNASDAISRMMAQKDTFDKAGYTTDPVSSYYIKVIVDEENKTLTIKDNGIGMTKAELCAFLGNIAASGTKKFREAMDKIATGDKRNADQMIGQFGLGFYSAFLVAERIDVITRSCKEGGYLWSASDYSSYSIKPHEFEDAHGTSVILKLKEGEYDYLKTDKLTEVIKKYTMQFPRRVTLVTQEVVTPEKDGEKEVEIDGEKDVEEIKEEGAEGKENETAQEASPTKKFVEKVINPDIQVWNEKIENIPVESLKSFYKEISNDYDDYAIAESWHFEGVLDMKILLFIPKRARASFFERQDAKCNSIHVYNSNMFVTKELDQDIAPEWMHFVAGTVSSSDFPMNVSREVLQGKGALNLLKNKLPKCIAEMIQKLQRNEAAFEEFYKQFSINVKKAVRHYSGQNQEMFAKFLKYTTNLDTNKAITLDEYIAMLPEDNKQILVLTGLSKKDVESSLFLETYKDKPVLLMHEPIDEVMLQNFKNYKGYTIKMISSADDNVSEVNDEEFVPLKNFIMEELKEKLEKVFLSSRPSASVVAALYSSKYASSGPMETLLKNQIGIENNPMIMMMLNSKKIMEVNTASPVIKMIKSELDQGNTELAKKYVQAVYQVSMINSGYTIDDRNKFANDVYDLLLVAGSKKNEGSPAA